jgi:hypothetical protein
MWTGLICLRAGTGNDVYRALINVVMNLGSYKMREMSCLHLQRLAAQEESGPWSWL